MRHRSCCQGEHSSAHGILRLPQHPLRTSHQHGEGGVNSSVAACIAPALPARQAAAHSTIKEWKAISSRYPVTQAPRTLVLRHGGSWQDQAGTSHIGDATA